MYINLLPREDYSDKSTPKIKTAYKLHFSRYPWQYMLLFIKFKNIAK